MPSHKPDDDLILAPGTRCDAPPCGACCRHVVRPPFYRLGDPAWLWLCFTRPDLVDAIEADRQARDVDVPAPCLWYDHETHRCKHYDLRPEVCHDFEPGSADCLRSRYIRGIGTEAEYQPFIGWLRTPTYGPTFGENP